ncbi:hypothetical protein SAMD00019534_081900, partial [Acytostelium subglobosum LB1]|uniref:hypothetical protein n=1 Tax=Acytostelium subglobosum LB1 TaxID=1410327 RepID=UPI0006449728
NNNNNGSLTTSPMIRSIISANDETDEGAGQQDDIISEAEEDVAMEDDQEEQGDGEDAPLPFNDDDDDQAQTEKDDETEEERLARLEATRLEKERLKKMKDEQRKQLAELEKKQREQLMADSDRSQKDRLKFLLERTEIFSHFVSNSSAQHNHPPTKKKKKGGDVAATPTKRGTALTEKEEDDEIMKEAIDEEAPHSFNFFTSNPPYIKAGTMRDYQIYGLNWLIQLYERGINGILADEMGLGKTLQTISLLGYLSEYKGIRGPHLIIAPKSTMSGWTKEFKRWCPFLRVVKFHGNKEERAAIKNEQLVYKKFDVCITTYEMVIKDKAVFKKFSWRYVIIDEAHRIKNENSVLSKGVRLFNSQFRLLITGTPLQNNLHELWALLNFLLPDVFSSSDDFDRWFDLEKTENQQDVIDKLHKVLRPFLLRRLKTEVEKSLPPKKEMKLFVGLSSMQREWYKRLLSKDYEALHGMGVKGGSGRVKLLNICMQLRKACNHPYLFDGAEEPPYTSGEHLVTNSGKMILLDKLLAKLKARGSRVLIFSQMARMLDILEDYMLYREYNYCRIDGSTDSQSRENYIEAYNEPDSKLFVFLLTTRAGGLGITLNTADIVVLFDSDWNPQVDLQAQDRAHRIGQTKPVTVYRFVTENSMEEKMVEKAEMKLQLDAVVIQQGRLVEQNKSASPEELLSMIRFGADDIFKCKDSSITDEDIDTILQKGEEKTQQITDRLKDLAKNPLKLNLDGNLYEFDGVNYRPQHDNFWGGTVTFKRERKPVEGNEEYMRSIGVLPSKPAPKKERKEKKIKPPKQPTIHDFQFYPEELNALFEKETNAYVKKLEHYEKKDATADEEEVEPDFGDLTEEEVTKKDQLMLEGFADWNRVDFRNFIRGCELYGRKAFDNITETVEGKTLQQVQEYAAVFWKRYKELTDYEKLIVRIEKGEERLIKYKETVEALDRKIAQYKNPWRDLKIQYGMKKNKTYNTEEDVFLVCKTQELGYGAWDELKEEIRKAPQFKFDWMIQTRTTQELKARCDQLLKYIIKEEQDELERKSEREKKKSGSSSIDSKASSPSTSTSKTESSSTSNDSKKSSKATNSGSNGSGSSSSSKSSTSTKRKKEDELAASKKSSSSTSTTTTTTTTTTAAAKTMVKNSKYSDSEDESPAINTKPTTSTTSTSSSTEAKPPK